ncbi:MULTISPECIES: DoxX family protein [unclassified Leeuwenhoekiella]|uniref:DoxX family protein n=1 Tax=unclassified Leeuwenhoekiella TaxID=2615029 RepID=UPI000C4A9227|nr:MULTISPECIES: DoxX family protein [unclassified Leeuwenhoekiella]MAW95326.1 hypothetical protein [Leeuwenhoekiella sp.]MBA81750.1 hypothetical protein [Leeuwenhoekiella sp.]|tara:strand:- start:17642 stop:17989 length:348 start_codon:yes stop_codon:yes gene_type:complete
MELLVTLAKVIIAISILIVWVLRWDNIVNEFKEYGLPDLIRNFVGASKIALSTLLITSIWYPGLAAIPALLMAFLMICAQFAHFKVNNPFVKHLPSLTLLALSLFIAGYHYGFFN